MNKKSLEGDVVPVSEEELRSVMRYWATGVAVVAAADEGEKHGMTVNSFTSLSLAPPLVLVSLEKGTRTHRLVEQAENFGLTILTASQQAISERFAGRDTEQSDRFEGLETHTLVTGSPFLPSGLAFIDCRLTASHPAGTHTIFIGEVLAARLNDSIVGKERALLYFNRGYHHL